jgi:uridylate kinase
MRIVVKIGGSVIASPLDARRIVEYSTILKRVKERGHEVVVVVGGGSVARDFIAVADKMGLPNNEKDEIAILVSRLNAKLLAAALGEDGFKGIPITTQEVSEALAAGRIVAMGGLRPGITTDTVAAIVLKSIGAKALIKATDQEGIYDQDPRKYKNAKKMDTLTYTDLNKIVVKAHKPGAHGIMDLESVRILESEKARLIVVNGLKPENILAAATGVKVGTSVEVG